MPRRLEEFPLVDKRDGQVGSWGPPELLVMFLEYHPLCMQLIISLSDWTGSLGREETFKIVERNSVHASPAETLDHRPGPDDASPNFLFT